MTEVLSGFRRVHSPDLEEARERVGEVFCPHRLEPVDRATPAPVRFNTAAFGAVGLSYLSYGSAVRIRPQPLRSFVLVQIPLSGRALVRTGGTEVVSDARTASVPDPDAGLDMTWESGNEQLIVRVEREALTGQLHRLLGRPPSKPLRLATSVDLTTPAARSWLSTVDMVRTDLDGPGGLTHPVLRAQAEQLLMSQLLAAVPHSSSDELLAAADPPPAVPKVIRRAEALIEGHAREPLTVDDVAEAVGLSVRSLQEGFRRHLDTTPTARLREARLAGVRAELTESDPTRRTVSQVAADWGFAHLGRFAVAYRERFGESPSETLRG
ncbi:Transcriptional regulator, AraC family [Pseudonocardia sp. Ae406_Ps2]|uniref:AraC family transcriptional regulator n=1 Tax=unclassified Pseudonocardia TaxID=2619320 RepID=UPI00094B2BDA|nr:MULTISPECIES: AraC family transcriptional regulator [unclassified Pseudonocardia]OLM02029.1 Transcriptional regulator, AraC family [Pseudonocardia sp. Ae406_Ps2]OLM06187.1 Transcriptional regulator, AraC family [Pseudonocardia sp. Ae331_Ps2]OLM12923.1 Transcriptional regulator, AraC family [Pseudonocardia sp. Ae505_Ps2]OLM23604.1 Transcriptional regulator, AraC family [Pseudonocardia sp. Ae706_Ps2]OLM32643.1 Transcriptional regulator, AraC family [Pseudonocardia sp. Ae717_Ps2]